MTFLKMIMILTFVSFTAEAKDLLPHRMITQKGNIQTSSDLDLTAIDNQALFLQPSEKGLFNSSFFFKAKAMSGNPYLDIRISFASGSYEFQVLQGKKWRSLGQIQAKADWQRVKLTLPGSPTD